MADVVIVDAETGEESARPMTLAETRQREKDSADDAAERAKDAARPDPNAEFRAALEGATTVAQLRDALLGTTGPGAQPRSR